MKEILKVDLHDYLDSWPINKREAVKAIFFVEGKLVMLQTSLGDLKFVGGGIEKGENRLECLAREVMEEIGYSVISQTVKEIGIVIERRKDIYENSIWEMTTYLYSCEVDTLQHNELKLTENEKKYGMNYVLYSPEEAIRINNNALKKDNCNAWVYRELEVLKLLFPGFIHI